MSKNVTSIKPLVGLGDLVLGMTRDEVRNVAGEPTEIEMIPDEEDPNNVWETWHYDDDEFSLSFEKEMDNRLSSIAISAPAAEIDGVKLIEETRDVVVAKGEEMDFGAFEEELLEEEGGVKVTAISYFDNGLDFYFENNICTEIAINLVFDDEEGEE